MSSSLSANSTLSESRFSLITDTDKAGILWIASLLSGIYAVLAILIRWYQKRRCFGIDDWVCVAATIIGGGSFVAIYVALCQGLGKSSQLLDASRLRDIGQAVFASRVSLIAALCLSKCSVTSLIKRLFSQDMQTHRMLCNFVLGAITLWGVSSVIGISIVCQPSELLDYGSTRCAGQTLRWQLIGAFDSLTEVMITFLTLGLIWRLQMRLELKIKVVLAFIFRLPLVAVATAHSRYVTELPSSNLSLAIIPALTIEQVGLAYSLISATIPNLKSFLLSFDTAMMMDISHKLNSSDHSVATAQDRFGSIRPQLRPRSDDIHNFYIGSLRPERFEHVADMHHTGAYLTCKNDDSDARPNGSRESQVRDRAIRRAMHWTVETTFTEAVQHSEQLSRSEAPRLELLHLQS